MFVSLLYSKTAGISPPAGNYPNLGVWFWLANYLPQSVVVLDCRGRRLGFYALSIGRVLKASFVQSLMILAISAVSA